MIIISLGMFPAFHIAKKWRLIITVFKFGTLILLKCRCSDLIKNIGTSSNSRMRYAFYDVYNCSNSRHAFHIAPSSLRTYSSPYLAFFEILMLCGRLCLFIPFWTFTSSEISENKGYFLIVEIIVYIKRFRRSRDENICAQSQASRDISVSIVIAWLYLKRIICMRGWKVSQLVWQYHEGSICSH